MLQKNNQHLTQAIHEALAAVPLAGYLISAVQEAGPPKSKLIAVSGWRFMAVCFALAGALGGAAAAWAQPSPASPQPEAVDRPTLAERSRAIRWDTFHWVERRYKIEAMRFKARDETGFDWMGSDEVMIETRDAKGWTVSREIGGIDSGDTHNFDPAKSCIVAVRPGLVVLGESSVCDEVGEPAPLGFDVEFWEKDTSPFGGFCVAGFPDGGHGGPYCANDTYGDDFIGSARIDYSLQELEAALPNVGDEQIETVKLDPCPDQICTSDSDYTFTWRVARLPDALVNLASLVKEAMRVTGAGTELEAIAEGLRSLRAPRQRKVEREPVDPPVKR